MSSVYSRKSARCFGRCGLLSNVAEEGREGVEAGAVGPIVAQTDKRFFLPLLCWSCFVLFDFLYCPMRTTAVSAIKVGGRLVLQQQQQI